MSSPIDKLLRKAKPGRKEVLLSKYKEAFKKADSILNLYDLFIPKGEIIIITYFLNSEICEARMYPSVITGVRVGKQILNAPFEIWDGYSHRKNFFIGVSIYESDSKASQNEGLLAIIRGILENDINDNFAFDNESGAKLLEMEQTFEDTFNQIMSDFGFVSPYIDKLLQPIEKFRVYFDWSKFNNSAVVARPRELENAKILINGNGYNDFYTGYKKKADNSTYSLTKKDDGNFYEEVLNNGTGQYETGANIISDAVLLKANNGDPVYCGGHFNWFKFTLAEVVIKHMEERWYTKW